MANFPTFLGTDEQKEGALFLRLLDPTDYDTAFEGVRGVLKDSLGFTDEFHYLGLLGGPLKDFLNRYIEASYQLKAGYSPTSKQHFYNELGEFYDKQTLDTYFNALSKAYQMGKVPKSIYNAYTYTPTEGGILKDLTVSSSKYLITAVLIGGAGYLLMREAFFGKRKVA